MATEADREGAVTLIGEEVQEVFVPAPCGVPGPVDEEQGHRVGLAASPFVDHLEHGPSLSSAGEQPPTTAAGG